MGNFYHIIEYPERNTLWRLLSDLTIYKNHHIIETTGQYHSLKQIGVDNNKLVFHASGRKFPMIEALKEFLSDGYNCFVFVHTLPDYIIEKGCAYFLSYIRALQEEYGIRVLVPSPTAQKMFLNYAIESRSVRLGIKMLNVNIGTQNLLKLKGKVITVNTNAAEHYIKAKGIDLFCDLVKTLGIQKQAAILGLDGSSTDGIERIRLTHNEFIWVLNNAKMYIQLSRSESYNITTIEAKQLKIPILVSSVGGHIDSVPFSCFRANSIDDAYVKFDAITKMDDMALKNLLTESYSWSIENENIDSFRSNIEYACQ